MLTVRFPSGVSFTYNNANFVYRTDNGWQLYTTDPKNGGEWVASIQNSAGCTIEASKPCRIENPVAGLTQAAAADLVLENLRELDWRRLKALKIALRDFNAKTCEWIGED